MFQRLDNFRFSCHIGHTVGKQLWKFIGASRLYHMVKRLNNQLRTTIAPLSGMVATINTARESKAKIKEMRANLLK